MTMFARLIPALRLRLFGSRKAASLLLAFIAAVSLTGCAGMHPQNAPSTPVPVPPGTVNAPKAADKTNDDQAFTPVSYTHLACCSEPRTVKSCLMRPTLRNRPPG